ncbi:unnamed protein product [Colias eurytheme]|nr:unnamed protein product [Colias eurytheme]
MDYNDVMQSDTDVGVGTRAQTERVRTRGRKAGPSGLSTATSVDSLMTVQSYEEDRLWAKRKRSSGASCSGSSTEGQTRTAKKGAKRGKGRSSGVARPTAARRALADLVAARKALVLAGGKPETERETQVLRSSQAVEAEAGGGRTDENESTAALRRRIEENLAVIEAKSSSLKGTSKRTLKDASEAIQEAVALLVQRTASEETRRLQADNTRLHGEIAALRKEMADMKATLGAAHHTQQQQTDSDLTANIMRQVGEMGSVLGPLLWNIGYDWVLRAANLPGVGVTCYADDTLVTARGASYDEAALLAAAGVADVVGRIRRLGLDVALEKSEAIFFPGRRRLHSAGSEIRVSGVPIKATSVKANKQNDHYCREHNKKNN